MKRKFKITLVVISILMLNHVYRNFFTPGMIAGTYANTNFNQTPFIPDMPYVADTLHFFKNNHFQSNYYGKGTYSINYDAGGTKINLNYKDEFGDAGISTYIERLNWGSPKIIQDGDRDIYYEKIED